MDGLSISNLKGVLEQGETLSELKKISSIRSLKSSKPNRGSRPHRNPFRTR